MADIRSRILTRLQRASDLGEKYVLITFDDGYYNNTRALPILEERGVPAVFFISVNHVIQQKPYWWDVLHREVRKASWSNRDMIVAKGRLKRLTHAEIDASLADTFGLSPAHPIGDTDRPLTIHELRELAGHSLVHIGNHTADHAILTNYSLSQARASDT